VYNVVMESGGSVKKRKFLKIAVIAVSVAVIAAATITLIIVIRRGGQVEEYDEQQWAQERTSIIAGIYDNIILGSEDAKERGTAYFDEQIELIQNPSQRLDLRLDRNDFLNNHGYLQEALDDLRKIESEETLTDEQRLHLYSSIEFAYRGLGMTEEREIYDQKVRDLRQILQGSNVEEYGGE